MCLGDFVGIGLACLSVDCDPEHFTFKGYRFFSVLLGIKSDLVVDEQNPLVPEEFFYLRISFAVRSIFTPLKLNVEERSFI